MTTGIKLLPLHYDELPEIPEDIVACMRSYARDNVVHAVAPLQAEIKALRVDVEAWKASHSMLTDTCHHFQAQAKRLAEALREMREYVTAALQAEREAFAGHEDSSDIPGIEADLHKIDALLREERRNKAARTDSTTYKEETND